MKIPPYQIDNYIQKIAQEKIAGCLIFGRDEGVITYRSNIISKKITPDLSDPFLVVNLNKERLALEPSIVSDEFFSFSMLGGRKLILVKNPDATATSAIKTLFENNDSIQKSDNFILIQAGDLDINSALRKIVESSKHLAAVACYEDDERIIKNFITSELTQHQIKFTKDTIDLLYEKLDKNRQIIVSEINKISTYLGKSNSLEVNTVNKIIGSEADIPVNDFVDNFSKQCYDLALIKAESLFKNNFEPVTLIRFLTNYLQKLHQAKTVIELDKIDFEIAIKQQKLFFKMESSFRKHLNINSLASITDCLKNLEQLEISAKSNLAPPKLLFLTFLQNLIIHKQ
jgi:DNA polymerase-3 subunit delta